ncbi:MAG: hypothetical protein GTN99_02830 [Candidatus Dadabacteria bacterium]|nr:hypothetical protein [Candidatus Dadabacteria bacterium]
MADKKKGLFSTGVLSRLKNKSGDAIAEMEAKERGLSSLRPANNNKKTMRKPKTKKQPYVK